MNEMSSSEQLDITVYNLGNLARQTVQHQAEPSLLRTDKPDVPHHDSRRGLIPDSQPMEQQAERAAKNTQVKVLVDNCVQDKQKIWHTILEVDFGFTSSRGPVYKGAVRINHAIAHSTSRAARLNFVICWFSQRTFRWVYWRGL